MSELLAGQTYAGMRIITITSNRQTIVEYEQDGQRFYVSDKEFRRLIDEGPRRAFREFGDGETTEGA